MHLKMFRRVLLENMLSDHKVWQVGDYIQTISHAGIQAEKPIFIKNQVFFWFAFATHSFYFHHPQPLKNSKQNHFAGSEPSKIYQFESFSLNPISVSHKYGPEKVDF